MCIWPVLTHHTHTADIHRYEAATRAGKERKFMFQAQLDTVQYEHQQKKQQLSKLEDENLELQKEKFDQHHEEVQPKGKKNSF